MIVSISLTCDFFQEAAPAVEEEAAAAEEAPAEETTEEQPEKKKKTNIIKRLSQRGLKKLRRVSLNWESEK